MAHVTNNTSVFHLIHMFTCYNVFVASARDYNIYGADNFIKFHHSESVHASLQRANRVNFCNANYATKTFEGLRTAFAHFTVSTKDNLFSAKHNVGAALKAINYRLLAAIQVVKLCLGHRVIYIHGRHRKFSGFRQLIQPMYSGYTFLNNS